MPLSCAVVPPTSVAPRWSPVRVAPEISWQTNDKCIHTVCEKTHQNTLEFLGCRFGCESRQLIKTYPGRLPTEISRSHLWWLVSRDVQCKYTGQFWQICGPEFGSKTENANTSGTAACRRSTRGILFGHLSCCRFRWQALMQNLCLLKDSVDDLAKNCFIYCNLFFKKVNASAHQKC